MKLGMSLWKHYMKYPQYRSYLIAPQDLRYLLTLSSLPHLGSGLLDPLPIVMDTVLNQIWKIGRGVGGD